MNRYSLLFCCIPQRTKDRAHPLNLRFFYFYIFYFRFLQKYIFVFEIYMNIPRPPGCRAAGIGPPGSRAAGAYLQKKSTKNCAKVPGGPAARQRSGGPWPPACGATGPQPYIRCWLPLTPSFASLKIQKKRKEREGGRGGVRERQSGETLSDFQAGDCR